MDSLSNSDHSAGPSMHISPDSVVEALQSLKEVKGTSLSTLKKYFRSKFGHEINNAGIWRQIKLAIGKGLMENKFVKRGRKIALDFSGDEDGVKMRRRRKVEEDDDSRRGRRRRVSRSLRRRRRRRRRRSKRRSGSKRRRRSSKRRRSGLKRKRRSSRKSRRSSRKSRRFSRKRRSARSARRRRRR